MIGELTTKAISIEYLPSEDEMDPSKPLVVGSALTVANPNITEDLTSREFFGVKRYITGLDELVIENDPKLSKEEKEAKLSETKAIVERLEKFYGPGRLDARNHEFWSKVQLTITRKTTNLDLTNPRHEILYHCIKAGGFNSVAKTMEEAESSYGNVRFYLIEPIEFISNKVAPVKLKNKALAELERLSNKPTEMFHVAKYLLPAEKMYTKRTPNDIMYEDLDKYINGKIIKKSQRDCVESFLNLLKKDKADIKIYNYIKDGVALNYIYTNPSGELVNSSTKGIYGTRMEKAVEHLKNPAYDYELKSIQDLVELYWNQ